MLVLNVIEPEALLAVLEKLAMAHESGSEERSAIEIAAKAILFIHATRQHDSFREYIASFREELTDEQKRILAAMGLE